jgi:hypothetical protein
MPRTEVTTTEVTTTDIKGKGKAVEFQPPTEKPTGRDSASDALQNIKTYVNRPETSTSGGKFTEQFEPKHSDHASIISDHASIISDHASIISDHASIISDHASIISDYESIASHDFGARSETKIAEVELESEKFGRRQETQDKAKELNDIFNRQRDVIDNHRNKGLHRIEEYRSNRQDKIDKQKQERTTKIQEQFDYRAKTIDSLYSHAKDTKRTRIQDLKQANIDQAKNKTEEENDHAKDQETSLTNHIDERTRKVMTDAAERHDNVNKRQADYSKRFEKIEQERRVEYFKRGIERNDDSDLKNKIDRKYDRKLDTLIKDAEARNPGRSREIDTIIRSGRKSKEGVNRAKDVTTAYTKKQLEAIQNSAKTSRAEVSLFGRRFGHSIENTLIRPVRRVTDRRRNAIDFTSKKIRASLDRRMEPFKNRTKPEKPSTPETRNKLRKDRPASPNPETHRDSRSASPNPESRSRAESVRGTVRDALLMNLGQTTSTTFDSARNRATDANDLLQ